MFEREKDCESVEFIELVAEAKKKDAQLEVFGENIPQVSIHSCCYNGRCVGF